MKQPLSERGFYRSASSSGYPFKSELFNGDLFALNANPGDDEMEIQDYNTSSKGTVNRA